MGKVMQRPWLNGLHVLAYVGTARVDNGTSLHAGCTCDVENAALSVLVADMATPPGTYLRMPVHVKDWKES